jgi:hypothetical protein
VSLGSVRAAMAGAAREEYAGAMGLQGEGEGAMAQPGQMLSPIDITEDLILEAKEERCAVRRLCCVREQEAEEAMGTMMVLEELEAEAEG